MKKFIALLVLISTPVIAEDWNSNPNNWNNNPSKFKNTPNNWDNNPSNWKNSPNNFANPRIIRDNSGNPSGYAVPKEDGGINFFDQDGSRKGYLPAR